MDENIRRIQQRVDELSARIAQAYADVPEAAGMAEIERVSVEVRRELNAAKGRGPHSPNC